MIWLARAASCLGVNLRGRWPRRELALTSPVQRKELMDAPARRGWSALALDVDLDGAVTLPLAPAEASVAE